MAEASAAKVFGTELTQQVARELLEVLDGAEYGGARRAVARRAGIGIPDGGDQHLRRRRQRTSSGHHRDGRVSSCRERPATSGREAEQEEAE